MKLSELNDITALDQSRQILKSRLTSLNCAQKSERDKCAVYEYIGRTLSYQSRADAALLDAISEWLSVQIAAIDVELIRRGVTPDT